MDEKKLNELFRTAGTQPPGEKLLTEMHVIVCPFCKGDRTIPVDFDSIHKCSCGACYKVCSNSAVETSVGHIADMLWDDDELNLIRSVPADFCNIIVEKDFDRLLALKHMSDFNGIERFCKYDIDIHLSLVWVKRLF